MNAKEFLLQVRKLDKMIENTLAEMQRWKDIANNATSNLTGEKVESTPNPRRVEDAICTYLDLETEMKARIDEFIRKKKDVISVIEQLKATEYDILHKLYVQNFTLQDVATLYQRDYGWATTAHGRALKNVQMILKKKEETT